jgi:CheY-like chemotaxis protein
MTFRKKILLVDHASSDANMIRTALEDTGQYLIKEEHERRLATNAARWFQPDLILFDTSTPDFEVNSAAHELQQDTTLGETPVVFVSANTADDGRVVSGGVLSGYSFFANPVRLEEFVGCIAELLKR